MTYIPPLCIPLSAARRHRDERSITSSFTREVLSQIFMDYSSQVRDIHCFLSRLQSAEVEATRFPHGIHSTLLGSGVTDAYRGLIELADGNKHQELDKLLQHTFPHIMGLIKGPDSEKDMVEAVIRDRAKALLQDIRTNESQLKEVLKWIANYNAD